MIEDLKQLERKSIEEIWNKGNLAFVDQITAPDAVAHDPTLPGLTRGPEGNKQFVSLYKSAFPDAHIEINDMVAEGNKVAVRWTGTGTHKGDFMGIRPTGKHISVTGITVDTFKDGKLVETWTNYDALGMLQQLGVVPALETSTAH